jgi:hypothetical protein
MVIFFICIFIFMSIYFHRDTNQVFYNTKPKGNIHNKRG